MQWYKCCYLNWSTKSCSKHLILFCILTLSVSQLLNFSKINYKIPKTHKKKIYKIPKCPKKENAKMHKMSKLTYVNRCKKPLCTKCQISQTAKMQKKRVKMIAHPSRFSSTNRHNLPIRQNCCNFWTTNVILISFEI